MHRTNRLSWHRYALAASALTALILSPLAPHSGALASAPKAQVTLRFSFLNQPSEILNNTALINAFKKIHPEITIKPEPVAGAYDQKLLVEASAGTLPDVVWTADAFTIPFARKHVVLNMQPLVDADPSINIKDIYKVFLDLGRVPGDSGLYMMPRDTSVVTLYYNRTLFRAAHIPYPTATWTYAQFVDAAHRLTKTDAQGRTTQWGLELPYNWWAFYVPWIEGFGGRAISADGKHATFSDPNSIKGVQAIADLYLKDKVVVPPTVNLGGDAFTLGRAAMYTHVRPLVPAFRAGNKNLDFDAQLMPIFPSGKRIVGMGTSGYAVSADSTHQKEAFEFVKFIVSPQGQRIFASTYASVPIRASLAEDPSWRKLPGPPYNNDAFVQGVKYGITPPNFTVDVSVGCGTVYSGQTSTEIGAALDKIVRGAGSVAATLKTLDGQINSCSDGVATQ